MSLQTKLAVLFAAAVALPVLYYIGNKVFVLLCLSANVYSIVEAGNVLGEIYTSSDDLSEDEAAVLKALSEIDEGRIIILADDDIPRGHYVLEGGQEAIIVPKHDLLYYKRMASFVPIFLAAELTYSVCYKEGYLEMGTPGQYVSSLRHFESAIRCFIRLQELGEDFSGVPQEHLEEWLEEAYIYREDKEAWKVRTQAKLVHTYPEYAAVVAAISD